MKYKSIGACSLAVLMSAVSIKAQTIDYSDINNWAAHGQKHDLSDTIATPFLANSDTKNVNVFFVHPTTYQDFDKFEQAPNADIRDEALNRETDKSTILFQASCFNNAGAVYAPRYRQANLSVFFKPNNKNRAALDLAYADVKAAFEYFLNNINNNKPFIIASHSQGTVHAVNLIKEFIDGKPLQQKMLAAYLIGMPVKKNEFTNCKPCAIASEANCFVSWRTYLHGEEGAAYLKLEVPNSIVVTNPINWRIDSLPATASKQVAVIKSFTKPIAYDAKVVAHNNILWITKPKFKGSIFLRKSKIKNLHKGDINLFYESIRKNLVERILAYESK
jgi:Protein of unknown function (DUF3089)